MSLFTDIISEVAVTGCVDCGKALPVLGSRSRCTDCSERESERVINEFCEPLSASASEVRFDIHRYAEDGCWDLEP